MISISLLQHLFHGHDISVDLLSQSIQIAERKITCYPNEVHELLKIAKLRKSLIMLFLSIYTLEVTFNHAFIHQSHTMQAWMFIQAFKSVTYFAIRQVLT